MIENFDLEEIASRLDLLFSTYKILQIIDLEENALIKKEVISYYDYLHQEDKLCPSCRAELYNKLIRFKKSYQTKIKNRMAKKASNSLVSSKTEVKPKATLANPSESEQAENASKLYRFKPGKSFRFFNNATIWDNSNITNEVAEMIVKKNPKNIELFEMINLPTKIVEKTVLKVVTQEEYDKIQAEEKAAAEAQEKASQEKQD